MCGAGWGKRPRRPELRLGRGGPLAALPPSVLPCSLRIPATPRGLPGNTTCRPASFTCPTPPTRPLPQSNDALRAEIERLRGEPSPLVAARAAREETLGDKEKFLKLLDNLQVGVWWCLWCGWRCVGVHMCCGCGCGVCVCACVCGGGDA